MNPVTITYLQEVTQEIFWFDLEWPVIRINANTKFSENNIQISLIIYEILWFYDCF